ncbi:FAD-binding oxidoreductase [Wenjunlia tyrosinilytica]|jgi:FAD/FMN-containing dehydrogenase|uniref:FAD-binding dehydrogenase n=1 Tax=Wenjunlia tyrosinilytica TaxID=1544741 RepID=A0A918DXT2_9ACTN|nr:FAD-binding oxidoreductase [Wenjunlia tyrosinilytica]GGO87715.1 FAD-binding dehydrogenase [Wenjunlia tyrosinilytica]
MPEHTAPRRPDTSTAPGFSRSGTGRRDLLRAGAGVAAAAWLTSCGPARATATASSVRSTSAGPKPSDWTAFQRDLDGLLVRPGDRRYTSAHRLFQPQFDGTRPSGVAYPSHPRDVVTSLAFARRFGVPVAIRAGGHSYAGWSSGTGLVVDVSAMKKVTSGAVASIGAGARLIDVYGTLNGSGRTVPAGSCPTVGVAGLTLGGGVGVTSRAYGLTCDNLTGAEIVTADGRILEVDAEHHSDLFWALRGGGGGNFGVVTELRLRTHAAPDCSYAFLSWPWSKAAAVIRAWQKWAPTASDALWANLHLTGTAGTPRVGVGANYLGGQSGLRDHLDRLVTAVGAQPTSSVVRTRSHLDTMLVMAGCSGWSLAQCHLPGTLPGQNPSGRTTRASYAARSDFYTRALSSAGIKALLAQVERYARIAPRGGSGSIAFDALGGATNRVKPRDTAFVHRDALFLAQYIANWPGSTSAAGIARSRAWLNGLHTAMRPHASGQAYQNYIDPKLTDWKKAYYGANAARLSQVKSAYDPDRLFRFPQAVPNG